jgi:hypothetical protein
MVFAHSANSGQSFIEKGNTDTATFSAGCFWWLNSVG